jgi:hypothetical protein
MTIHPHCIAFTPPVAPIKLPFMEIYTRNISILIEIYTRNIFISMEIYTRNIFISMEIYTRNAAETTKIMSVFHIASRGVTAVDYHLPEWT